MSLITSTVEIFYSGAWHDITDDVQLRDMGIQITRGRSSEGEGINPGTARLNLRGGTSRVNTSVVGRYSPRNPNSDLFGLIGQNTEIRITASGVARFTGGVVQWPLVWDLSGNDVWMPIEAAGVLRRIGIPNKPLRSASRRFVELNAARVSVSKGYWPLEGSGVGLLGGASMKASAGVAFDRFDGIVGSLSLPTLGGGTLSADHEGFTASEISLRGLFRIPSSSATGAILREKTSNGIWELQHVSGGSLRLRYTDDAGTTIDETGVIGFDIGDKVFAIRVTITQDGSDVDVDMAVASASGNPAVEIDGGGTWSDTFTGVTLGSAYHIIIGDSTLSTDFAAGHVGVATSNAVFVGSPSFSQSMIGHDGETAGARMFRLATEEGFSFFSIDSSSGDTVPMGPQQPGLLLDLFNECVAAEAAGSTAPILIEQRSATGLLYRSRRSLYNRATDITLNYTTGHLSPPFLPVEDDRFTVNDVTVKRQIGGEFGLVQETGPHNTSDPADDPEGVGVYDRQITLNVETVASLAQIAGWWLHFGTWSEARYPSLTVNLRRIEETLGDSALRDRLLAAFEGHIIEVTNPPEWLPPESIRLMVLGYNERFSTTEHIITYNCVPANPYSVFVLDDDVLGRLDTAGSELSLSVDSDDTSLTVATDSGKTRWTTTAERPTDFPFNVRLGGEVVTVTAISGTSSPQTFTVTRSVNGISRSWPAGTRIRLARLAVGA